LVNLGHHLLDPLFLGASQQDPRSTGHPLGQVARAQELPERLGIRGLQDNRLGFTAAHGIPPGGVDAFTLAQTHFVSNIHVAEFMQQATSGNRVQ